MASIVIKVKYGETLRRFNALVDGDQRLNLDMEGLRVKISSLFQFPPDANFSLTYLDEDGDLVTLVDDEDLHDVVRQGLNPVRINVHLNTDKSVRSSARSSGSSTYSRSSSQNLHENINPGVAQVLKSVPEPVLDALSKLSHDLASKAASTSPIVADLIENFSKMGQTCLNTSHARSGGADVSNHKVVSDDPKDSSANKKLEASLSDGVQPDGVQQPATKSTEVPSVNVASGAQPSLPPTLPHFLFHKGKNACHEPIYCESSTGGRKKDKLITGDSRKKDKGIIGDSAGKSRVKNHASETQVENTNRVSFEKETTEATSGKNKGFQDGRNSSKPTTEFSPFDNSPFMRIPQPSLFGQPGSRCQPSFYSQPGSMYPSQLLGRSFSYAGGTGAVFHKGIRCDGCGVLPITGQRFKSKVRHDYDLCSICFARMGNDAEYTRINAPEPYMRTWPSKGFYDPLVPPHPSMQVPPTHHLRLESQYYRSKLDSRFIMDVNVVDNTTMAPSTPFTKIWRMCNNGMFPWHRGLQLLWIGGDRFSSSDSVEIEIPVDGVSLGNELDIAVNFIAPELPGRYISYWRMAGPSGHKFGQRIWALIQVDASPKDTTPASSPTLNLNLPHESVGSTGPSILDVNVEPAVDVEAGDQHSTTEADNSSVVKQKLKIEIDRLNFPINDDLLVGGDVPPFTVSPTASSWAAPLIADNPVIPAASSVSYPDVYPKPAASRPSVSYPIVDISEESSSATSSNVKEGEKNPEQVRGENKVEETLLKELEAMGFKQVDLNKEVLRMNEYNLEQSVDDLCGVSEWDPMLEELQEMGFHDKETNKKLLVRNNGSIMRVVMDLVSGEKA